MDTKREKLLNNPMKIPKYNITFKVVYRNITFYFVPRFGTILTVRDGNMNAFMPKPLRKICEQIPNV